MKNIVAALLGFVGSPIAAVIRLCKGEWPRWPTDSEFQPQEEGDFWHYSKNAVATVIQRNPIYISALIVVLAIF